MRRSDRRLFRTTSQLRNLGVRRCDRSATPFPSCWRRRSAMTSAGCLQRDPQRHEAAKDMKVQASPSTRGSVPPSTARRIRPAMLRLPFAAPVNLGQAGTVRRWEGRQEARTSRRPRRTPASPRRTGTPRPRASVTAQHETAPEASFATRVQPAHPDLLAAAVALGAGQRPPAAYSTVAVASDASTCTVSGGADGSNPITPDSVLSAPFGS